MTRGEGVMVSEIERELWVAVDSLTVAIEMARDYGHLTAAEVQLLRTARLLVRNGVLDNPEED